MTDFLNRYTDERVKELHVAFDRVKNPENWKLPVNAVVDLDTTTADGVKLQADISEAVTFFTGSTATFTKARGKNKVRVRAAGYYRAIGA